MEENRESYILWRLHCLIFINTFDMIKGGTSQNLSSFYFHNSCIYVETMTQNFNFHKMTDAVSCLPEQPKNVQGYTYCKQRSHGLYLIHIQTESRVLSGPFTITCQVLFNLLFITKHAREDAHGNRA